MKTVASWFGARLAEPSTHAAVAAMAAASIPLFGPYAGIVSAVFGVLGVVVKETK